MKQDTERTGSGVPQGLPFGRLRCTAEHYPKVLEVNDEFIHLLGLRRDSEDWKLIESNLFFLVPQTEREAFRHWLDQAAAQTEPVWMEHKVLAGNRRKKLAGWVAMKISPKTGESCYEIAYMQLPWEQEALEWHREENFRAGFFLAFDRVYEVDLWKRVVQCVHCKEDCAPETFSEEILSFEEEFQQGSFLNISQDERETFREFILRAFIPGSRPQQIEVTAEIHGVEQCCQVLAMLSGVNRALLCCRYLGSNAAMVDVDAQSVRRKMPRVEIRTFGHFDVFVDGKPVVFSYEKSKELLAVLVDRNGGFVTQSYLISCLWEDEPYGERLQSRCRQAAFRLMRTLEEYGIQDIVERVHGKRRVVPERVKCDYFDYMRKAAPYRQWLGYAYMSNYSWGEVRLSELLQPDAAY